MPGDVFEEGVETLMPFIKHDGNMDLAVHAGQQYRSSSVRIRHPASLPKKSLYHGKPSLPRPGTSSLSTDLRLKDIGNSLGLLSTTALCPGSTGVPPVPLEFQQMKGMIRELLHDSCLKPRHNFVGHRHVW